MCKFVLLALNFRDFELENDGLFENMFGVGYLKLYTVKMLANIFK